MTHPLSSILQQVEQSTGSYSRLVGHFFCTAQDIMTMVLELKQLPTVQEFPLGLSKITQSAWYILYCNFMIQQWLGHQVMRLKLQRSEWRISLNVMPGGGWCSVDGTECPLYAKPGLYGESWQSKDNVYVMAVQVSIGTCYQRCYRSS